MEDKKKKTIIISLAVVFIVGILIFVFIKIKNNQMPSVDGGDYSTTGDYTGEFDYANTNPDEFVAPTPEQTQAKADKMNKITI